MKNNKKDQNRIENNQQLLDEDGLPFVQSARRDELSIVDKDYNLATKLINTNKINSKTIEPNREPDEF